VQSEDLEL